VYSFWVTLEEEVVADDLDDGGNVGTFRTLYRLSVQDLVGSFPRV
jgi:hypothetical protein